MNKWLATGIIIGTLAIGVAVGMLMSKPKTKSKDNTKQAVAPTSPTGIKTIPVLSNQPAQTRTVQKPRSKFKAGLGNLLTNKQVSSALGTKTENQLQGYLKDI